jgi:hypothetical protein
MTGRTFNDFWNHWRALNGLPPRLPRPWPPDDPDDPDTRPSTAERTSGQRKAVASRSVPLVPTQSPPCKCGSTEFIIGKGKGPHAAKLCCSKCGRLRRWVGRRELLGA